MYKKPLYKEKYIKLYNINSNVSNTNVSNTNVSNTNVSNISFFTQDTKYMSPPPYEEIDCSILHYFTPTKLKQLVNDNLIYFTKNECIDYIEVFTELINLN